VHARRRPGRSRRRSAARRPRRQGTEAPRRDRGAAHRLRLVQPDDARRWPQAVVGGLRLPAGARASRRHVPAHAARRVRRVVGTLTTFLCKACGTQYPPSDEPPAACPICEDPRQYIPHDEGQVWLTFEELLGSHKPDIRDDHGLLGIGCTPSFSIGQRALLV